MLEFIDNLGQLKANVLEYQEAARGASTKATPSRVRAWYHIPNLNMVGASRFIGYKDMTATRYDTEDEVDGRETESHLHSLGWFRQLTPGEASFVHARTLAESLSRSGSIREDASFYVLKEHYDALLR